MRTVFHLWIVDGVVALVRRALQVPQLSPCILAKSYAHLLR